MSRESRTVEEAPNPDQLLRIALIAVFGFFVLTLGTFFIAQTTNSAALLSGAIYVVAGLSVGLTLLGVVFGIRRAQQENRSEASYKVVPPGWEVVPAPKTPAMDLRPDLSFEEAITEAVNRATSTLRNVESAHVKDMNVLIEDGNIAGYKVNAAITFVLEEEEK